MLVKQIEVFSFFEEMSIFSEFKNSEGDMAVNLYFPSIIKSKLNLVFHEW